MSIKTSINLSMHLISYMHKKIATSRISISHTNHTHMEAVVGSSEDELEDTLVEGKVYLHDITMDNHVSTLETSYNPQRHVHIVRDRTSMWSNVLS